MDCHSAIVPVVDAAAYHRQIPESGSRRDYGESNERSEGRRVTVCEVLLYSTLVLASRLRPNNTSSLSAWFMVHGSRLSWARKY